MLHFLKGEFTKYVLLLTFLLLCFQAHAMGEVTINEVMLSTSYFYQGENDGWLELYNDGDTVNLNTFQLKYENNEDAQIFTLPSYELKANKYYVVFFSGYTERKPYKDAACALPFVTKKKGGTFTLLDAQNKVIDRMILSHQTGDISYGKAFGSEQSGYFEISTRGTENSSVAYQAYLFPLSFMITGGFYDKKQTLQLMAETDAEIHYTINGETPTLSSPLYTHEIEVGEGVTVIRARAFHEKFVPSKPVTQTYFINVKRDVPVVSLVTDEQYLFSQKTGALVPGNGKVKNYYKNYEYPLNFEYFNEQKKCEINQMATFRVTGATSRKFAQKSLSVFARPAFGQSTFKFNPFPNRDTYTEYKALTLRAGGTECYLTRFKDALLTRLAKDTGVFYQESKVVVVYLNGKFYGQYNLREKINKHALAAYENITDEQTIDQVTIIKGRGEVTKGSIDEWDALIKYFKTHDLRESEHLTYVSERLDIDNYLTMVAFQIINGNGDIGNQRLYKFNGGKFKYVLYDLDGAMMGTSRMPIAIFTKSVTASNTLFYHEPFSALIKNKEIQDRFLHIVGYLLKEKYVYSDLEKQVDEWVDMLSPLMEEQMKRFPRSSPKSMGTWKYEVNHLKKMLKTRPKYVINYLSDYFRLDKEEKEHYFGDYLSTL